MKIIFIIESLHFGGKERLAVELLSYLKQRPNYELRVVLLKKDIYYLEFLDLGIPFDVIERKWFKKDPRIFYKFYKLCKRFKPDIIHTYGNIVTTYVLPSVFLRRIPLLNNQISDAPPKINKWSLFFFLTRINFWFSSQIIANSHAGLQSYHISANNKSKVIYNGTKLGRFQKLSPKEEIKEKYHIATPFAIIMVASFSDNKDYDKFLNVAIKLNSLRSDVTFVSVGNGIHFDRIRSRVISENIPNIVFTGRINDLESLISACDIGVLFSPNGEGISCVITEYMALGKPVIADSEGGTKEIIEHGKNGYLFTKEDPLTIAELINNLLNDNEARIKMGQAGRLLIEESFSIDKMGKSFEAVYLNLCTL